MKKLPVPTQMAFGLILSLLISSYGYADHLTTGPGEERKIFHGPYDPAFNQPQPLKTGWGLSLRVGGAFRFDDDIATVSPDPLILWEVSADEAFLLNGQIFYHIDRYVHVGLSIEWEAHSATLRGVDVGTMDIGTIRTISLLPYIELHYPTGRWSPYAFLGLGANLNDFDEDDQIAAICTPMGVGPCNVSFKNTVAIKGGAGVDFFVTRDVAVNAEVAWKLNSGGGKFSVGATSVFEEDIDSSAFQAMLGLRWYIK